MRAKLGARLWLDDEGKGALEVGLRARPPAHARQGALPLPVQASGTARRGAEEMGAAGEEELVAEAGDAGEHCRRPSVPAHGVNGDARA